MDTVFQPKPSARDSIRWPSWRVLTLAVVMVLLALLLAAVLSMEAISQARASIRQGDPELGIVWLNRASWFFLHDGEIQFLRARCFRKLGHAEAFRKAIISASEKGVSAKVLDREQTYFLAQAGQLTQVEHRMGQIFREAGEDAGEACEAYATGLALNLRQTEALVVTDYWAKDYPDDARPEFVRGLIFSSMNRTKLAEQAFRRAVELDPDSSEIQLKLGALLMETKQLDGATVVFRGLLRNQKYHDIAWLNISRAERLKGDLPVSRQALESIRNPSQFLQGDVELATGLLAIDQRDYELGERLLRPITEKQPRNLEAQNALAIALRGLGRREEAEEQSENVATAQNALSRGSRLYDDVVVHPHDPLPRIEIGRIELQYGDEQRGVAWLLSALNLEPENTEANSTLAEHYEQQASSNKTYAELAKHYRLKAEAAADSIQINHLPPK